MKNMTCSSLCRHNEAHHLHRRCQRFPQTDAIHPHYQALFSAKRDQWKQLSIIKQQLSLVNIRFELIGTDPVNWLTTATVSKFTNEIKWTNMLIRWTNIVNEQTFSWLKSCNTIKSTWLGSYQRTERDQTSQSTRPSILSNLIIQTTNFFTASKTSE